MAKKKKNKKKRYNTSLGQHKQQGKRLVPPMMFLPGMTLTYWLKDDFPNMLWLCMLCQRYEDRGMVIARKVFDAVERILEEEYGSMDDVPKDIFVNGMLTSFDTVPESLRSKIITELETMRAYDTAFPKDLSVALNRYENPPGRWIWEGSGREAQPSDEEKLKAQKLLAETTDACWSGRNECSTWAKMAVTSALFSSGRVKISAAIAQDWGQLLPKYPHGLTDDERKKAEASMRAMYQGIAHMPAGNNSDLQSKWAKEFWRSNWTLYECKLPTESEEASDMDDGVLTKFAKHLEERFSALNERFFSAAETDPDLYEPVRYEVLTGIVSRARRAVSVAIGNPLLWSTEHGSGTVRTLVESRIVLAWLLHQDDSKLFTQFKDYGRGHLKLLKLHLEEFLDKQRSPDPDLKAHVAELDKAVNQDISEEFQDIRITPNFSDGISTRKMAQNVGLSDDYKFIFAPASSTFHGEWPAVDQFALVLCQNPLHRGHKIVRKDSGVVLGASLIEFALDQLEDLIGRYESGITNS